MSGREMIKGWDELTAHVGRSRESVIRYMKLHRFPRPMILSDQRNTVLWYKDVVDTWLNEVGLPEIVLPRNTKKGRYK